MLQLHCFVCEHTICCQINGAPPQLSTWLFSGYCALFASYMGEFVRHIEFVDDSPVSLIEVDDSEFVEFGHPQYFLKEKVVDNFPVLVGVAVLYCKVERQVLHL
jgi:hypothetical protein